MEGYIHREGVRKEPFDKEVSKTFLPEAVGGGVRRPALSHLFQLIMRLEQTSTPTFYSLRLFEERKVLLSK